MKTFFEIFPDVSKSVDRLAYASITNCFEIKPGTLLHQIYEPFLHGESLNIRATNIIVSIFNDYEPNHNPTKSQKLKYSQLGPYFEYLSTISARFAEVVKQDYLHRLKQQPIQVLSGNIPRLGISE